MGLCGRQTPGWSQEPYLLVLTPLSAGGTYWLTPHPEYSNSDRVFAITLQKTRMSVLPEEKLPSREAVPQENHVGRNGGCVTAKSLGGSRPKSLQGTESANNPVNWKQMPPHSGFRWDLNPGWHIRTVAQQRIKPSCAQTPDPQKLGHNKRAIFKSLSLQ